MKRILAALAVVALTAAPAMSKPPADKGNGAAKHAGASMQDADKGKPEKKVKADKADHDFNWGKSEDRRQDDEHGHKGKGKHKGRD